MRHKEVKKIDSSSTAVYNVTNLVTNMFTTVVDYMAQGFLR